MIPVLTNYKNKINVGKIPVFLSNRFKLYSNESKYICYLGEDKGQRVFSHSEENKKLNYEDWLSYIEINDEIIKDINSNNCLLLIGDIAEGFDFDIIKKSLDKFLHKFNIKKSNVMYFNGTFPIESFYDNNVFYCKSGFVWSKELYLDPIRKIYGETFWYDILYSREENRKNNNFEYDFINLNHAYRYHRHYVAIKIFSDNFFVNNKKTIVTWHANNSKLPAKKDISKFKEWHNDVNLNYNTFNHMISRYSPYANTNKFFDSITSIDKENYINVMMGIVNETWLEGTDCYPTEKIIKQLLTGQPFVLIGRYKTIEYLRNEGFYVYDDLIDHSYDNELDPFIRIEKALLSAKKFDIDRYQKNFNINNVIKNIKLFSPDRYYNILTNNIIKKFINM